MKTKLVISTITATLLVAGLSGCSNAAAKSQTSASASQTPTPSTLCEKYSESITWLQDRLATDGDLTHLSGFDFSGLSSDVAAEEPNANIDYKGTYQVQPSKLWVEYIKIFGKCMDKTLKSAVIDATAKAILDGK